MVKIPQVAAETWSGWKPLPLTPAPGPVGPVRSCCCEGEWESGPEGRSSHFGQRTCCHSFFSCLVELRPLMRSSSFWAFLPFQFLVDFRILSIWVMLFLRSWVCLQQPEPSEWASWGGSSI